MIASEESLLSPMLHLMQLFSLLIVLIERSQSHNVTGRVAAILRRIYRLGKSSARVTCFQGRSAWICRNYPSLHLSSSNAQIRQRGAVAKADHLCIDLLSQLVAEQWFGFPTDPHWLSCISSTISLSIWTKLSIYLKASTQGWCNCKVCFTKRNSPVVSW